MKYDLANIENSTAKNAGGLCSFIFAPKEWIDDDVVMSLLTHQTTAAVTMIGGHDWLLATCLQDSMGFSESQDPTPAGNKFTQVVNGMVNGDSLINAGLMNGLTYHEYVVIYTGRNGEKRIIGNKTKGMTFVSQFATGSQYSEKHAYPIAFSFESAERAPWYSY